MENFFKQLNLTENDINLINATIAPEFAPTFQIISNYKSKSIEFSNIYSDTRDIRNMFFIKMLNTLYSYNLDRCLINGLVDTNLNTQNWLKNLGLSEIINNWNTFKISHNFYNSFVFYIRLFSCLESTLREIYFYLYPNEKQKKKFFKFHEIYTPMINDNSLKQEYTNLLKLLASIRNLIHNMGVSNIDDSITYNGITYNFEAGKVPAKEVVNMINLLDLYNNDVLDFISDFFRMSYITDVTRYFCDKGFLNDVELVQLRLDENFIINIKNPEWYQKFLLSLAKLTGKKKRDCEYIINNEIGFTETMKYIVLGNADSIIIHR